MKDKDNDISVVTGADAKSWNEATAVTSVLAYANETNGYGYAELAFVELNGIDVPGSASSNVYGYVVKVLGETEENDKDYLSYSVWTGAENETVKIEATTANVAAGVAKGNFIMVDGGNIYVLGNTANSKFDAIKGYDEDSIAFYNNQSGDTANNHEFEITADTKVIYVNTKDVAGVAASNSYIREATDHNIDGVYEINALFVKDGYELDVLFVDIRNEMENGYIAVSTVSPSAADIHKALDNGVAHVTGTVPSGVTVKDGQILIVDQALTNNITVKNGGALVLNGDLSYDLTKITSASPEVGAIVMFSDNVTKNADWTGNMFFTATGTVPVALANRNNPGDAAYIAANITGQTYLYVADVNTGSTTTPGFLLQK